MIFLPALILASAAQRSATISIPDSTLGYLTDVGVTANAMRMAQDGNKIAIVYDTSDATTNSLMFSYSSDLGRTLTRPVRIVTGNRTTTAPKQYSIAMGGGSIWVSYRRSDKLYVMESTGAGFGRECQIASGVGSVITADDRYDARNQWIGYSDGGLVIAYPSKEPKNVLVGRVEANVVKNWGRPSTVALKEPKPLAVRTTALLKNPFSVGTVRVYPQGRTVRVLSAKNIDPKWVVGMSLSHDGGRTWDIVRNDQSERDNHVTYLGYQEMGDNIRFKGIGTVNLAGDFELTVGNSGREWVAIKGDNPTWGTTAWQIVTSDDLTRGLFHGTGMVLPQWYESVNLRGRPEARTGETSGVPLPAGKPSIVDSRGFPEAFWNQGYHLSRGPGTAWQTTFNDTDLHTRYVGVSTPIWRTYVTPPWSNAEAYRRTSSIRNVYLNDLRTFAIGPEVVHVGIKNHPTRRGAFQTVYKPKITLDWSPLIPGEDAGSMDWVDCASSGNNGFLIWISGGRICARSLVAF